MDQGWQKVLRGWLYQSFLFVFAAAVALTLLEVGFRLARRESDRFGRLDWRMDARRGQPRKIYDKSQEYEFTAAINSEGFRGPEISSSKPDGVKRILVLGDSFIFGWGVNDDQTFVYLLDRELNKNLKRYEIINAAGRSVSPLIYYVMLKQRLLDFHPDLVVVFINYADVREDYLFKSNIIRDKEGDVLDVDPLYIDGKLDFWRWLRKRCEICSYTYNKLSRPLKKIELLGFWNYMSIKLRGGQSREALLEAERSRQKGIRPIELDPFFMLRAEADPQEVKGYWDETAQYLAMIQGMLGQRSIPMILALLPNGAQVSPDQWSGGRELRGFERGKVYGSSLMLQLIQSFARERKIGFVDLLPAFQQSADRPLFFDGDGHMTPDGHAALARGLLSSSDFRGSIDSGRP